MTLPARRSSAKTLLRGKRKSERVAPLPETSNNNSVASPEETKESSEAALQRMLQEQEIPEEQKRHIMQLPDSAKLALIAQYKNNATMVSNFFVLTNVASDLKGGMITKIRSTLLSSLKEANCHLK
jgi:hypothetical protein